VKPKKIVTIKIVCQRIMLIKNKNSFKNIKILTQESWKPDFSRYKSVPSITLKDIGNEKKRIKEISEKLKTARNELKLIKVKLNCSNNKSMNKLRMQFYETMWKINTYQRSLLEAKLSAVILKKSYDKLSQGREFLYTKSKEFDEIYRDIGYSMNEARINKRAYDYLIEYYKTRFISQ